MNVLAYIKLKELGYLLFFLYLGKYLLGTSK